MSEDDENAVAARETVIEALERSAEVYGLKRSYGRLYGLLFFAEGPLSLDELVAESGYAKSTVSTAMGALERFHLVRRRSVAGEGKKAFFEAETEFWRVFQELLDSEARREIRIMSRALADAEETLAAADGERAAEDLEKVRRLKRVYDQFDRFLDVMTSQSLDRIVSVLDRLR